MSFTNPDVFKKVQELTGQTVDVELTKNDKGYTEWKSVNVGASSSVGATAPQSSNATTRVSGSNYETKEERAARQVLIVKQSSLSNAVAILATGAKTTPKTDEVIKLAQELADWVFETDKDDGSIADMSDDIPF